MGRRAQGWNDLSLWVVRHLLMNRDLWLTWGLKASLEIVKDIISRSPGKSKRDRTSVGDGGCPFMTRALAE